LGQRKQLEELAASLGMEAAFAKPFCALRPDPAKPNIAAFLEKAGIGEPLIEVAVQKSRGGKDHIVAANVIRTAPCGSTWFVAKRLLGLEPDQEDIRRGSPRPMHIPVPPQWKETRSLAIQYYIRAATSSARLWRPPSARPNGWINNPSRNLFAGRGYFPYYVVT
jgi:hypothetical protein